MYIDDNILVKIESGSEYSFTVFEAEKPVVILGRSRKKENDVNKLIKPASVDYLNMYKVLFIN